MSLRHYILIDQARISVLHYEKIAGKLWAIVGNYTAGTDTITLKLDDKPIVLSLSRIYRRVSFADEDAAKDANPVEE